MLESIRLIIVLEATGAKELLATYLKSQIENITHVDTMVDALTTVKRQRFDAAILSSDMEDYYSVDNMKKILKDIGSIDDIVLVSEKEDLPADSTAISLANPMEAHAKILRQLEKISLKAGQKPLRMRVAADGNLSNTSLFDSVPSGLYRIKPSGEFVELNQTLANIFKAPSLDVMKSDNYFSMFVDQQELKT